MAKKKKIKETTIQDYYDLKIDKIDELVSALKGEESEEEISMNIADCTGIENSSSKERYREFDPYKVDRLSRIPTFIKALFIKWWFAGAVCYFVVMGLGSYILGDLTGGTPVGANLDLLVLTGLALGLITDVLVNPLFRYMETDRKEYNNYMMFPFPFKAFWTFFTNLIYYIIVMVCVSYCYFGLNEFIKLLINGAADSIPLGVEPLLFAVIAVLVDMAFIGIKDGVVSLIKRLKNKKREEVAGV